MDDDLFSNSTSMFDDTFSSVGINSSGDDLFSSSSSSIDDLMFNPANSWSILNIFHQD